MFYCQYCGYEPGGRQIRHKQNCPKTYAKYDDGYSDGRHGRSEIKPDDPTYHLGYLDGKKEWLKNLKKRCSVVSG